MGKLKLQTKLVLVYVVLIVCIISIVGVTVYTNVTNLFLRNAYSNDYKSAVAIKEMLELTLVDMRNVCTAIQQNNEIITTLKAMSEEESAIGNRFTYKMWLKRNLLASVNANSKISRISVFNENGDFISTGEHIYENSRISELVTNAEWYNVFNTSKKVSEYIVLPHYDLWSDSLSSKVFSIVRPMYYFDQIVGFVEVQCRSEFFEQFFLEGNSESNLTSIIVLNDNRVFYSNAADTEKILAELEHYQSEYQAEKSDKEGEIARDEIKVDLRGNDVRVVIIDSTKQIHSLMKSFLLTFGYLMMTVLGVSLLFSVLLVRKLTIPLRRLKQRIDETQADTLSSAAIPENTGTNDEIVLIENSFVDMQKRLKLSMENEIRLQTLQTKARFETLQARINPHFLYNSLGVISGKCIEIEEYDISEMCVRLASVLRYSLSTPDSLATIEEEMENARDYLYIMKKRYEQRLQYTFHEDSELNSALLPRLCIQPLIENSFIHGFETKNVETMQISILSRVLPDNRWEIEISDNGSGFDSATIEKLNQSVVHFNSETPENIGDLTKGSMGILNTFARIRLFSKTQIEMNFANNEEGGALIRIRCAIIK